MSWAAIIVGVVGTAATLITGGVQKHKANKALADLNRNQPIETIPQEILQNQELASLRSKTGLPSEQYAMAQKNIERQQARSLKAAMDRKMGLNLIGTLDDNANTAQGNLDVANAQARLGNEKTLMNVNNQVGNWRKGIYDRNVRQVWNRNFDYNMALKGQGNQNIANGINSGINLAGTAITGAMGGSNSSWANGLFGRRKNNNNNNSGYGGGNADGQGGY
jgi:hypothetical protein